MSTSDNKLQLPPQERKPEHRLSASDSPGNSDNHGEDESPAKRPKVDSEGVSESKAEQATPGPPAVQSGLIAEPATAEPLVILQQHVPCCSLACPYSPDGTCSPRVTLFATFLQWQLLRCLNLVCYSLCC